ncbi:MAG: hypothetical protein K2J83_05655, partial [Clostridia bacterium]|nr:hypothetical protein [Clostridia bacterium]
MKIHKRNIATIILAIFCALALALGVSFVLPASGNIADAAVSENEVTYSANELLQYYNPTSGNNLTSIPYSSFGAVNTARGTCTFDSENARVDISRTVAFHQTVGYASFTAEIVVPALTEYKVDFSYSVYLKRSGTSQSATVSGDVYFYGDTGSDPTASDKSNIMLFVDGPQDYIVGSYVTAINNTAVTRTGTIPTVTLTNETNDAVIYYAFFGFCAYTPAGTAATNNFTSYLEMSDDITVTAIDVPTVDRISSTYTGSDINFNIQNWDTQRVVLTKATRQKLSGGVETLYQYDNVNSNVISGANPLSPGGVMTVTDVGTYTLYFDILNNCGAVWDSATNDQATKPVTFKVEPKKIDKPTIGTNDKPYSGSELSFALSSNISLAEWSTYIQFDSVTEASGGSTSSVNNQNNGTVGITDVGTYNLNFTLSDRDNTVWTETPTAIGGTASVTLKVSPKTLSTVLNCSSLNGANWEWGVEDTNVTITAEISDFILSSDADENDSNRVTLKYYYLDGGSEISLNGDIQSEIYDPVAKKITATIAMPNLAQGTYTFGVKPDGTTGANGNYTVSANAATHSFTVGSASLNPSVLLWTYLKNNNATNETISQNAQLTYETNSGTAVTYKPQIQLVNSSYDYSSYVSVVNYTGDSAQNTVGSYAVTVSLRITDSDHVFANPDNDSNITVSSDGLTATVRFGWSIEQKEIDLSNVTFEYNDGVNGWNTYSSDNPPEKSGLNFEIRVSAANMPEGVTAVTPQYGLDRKGPGTINFDLAFTLDSNYKSATGSNIVAYSMQITGMQITANWVATTLKDENGNDVVDDQGVPYNIYVLDVDPTDPAYQYIRYEYYTDGGSSYGSIIAGGLDTIIASTADGGMGASSTNPVQVYVRAVLDGMTLINGVDPYELKFSPSQPEYKKILVGDNKDVVDLTAGTTTSVTYGNNVTASDTYKVTVRATGTALNPAGYKVSLYKSDGATLIEDEIRNGFDFSGLDAGTYKLIFELVAPYDDSYVLTSSNLNFTVKPVELVVPMLKDGATFTFNGEEQSLSDELDNWDATFMEFASNSVHEARNAGSYTVIINIKSEYAGNYIFVLPASSVTPATTVRYVLADEVLPEISNSSSTASFKWTIEKYVIDTTAKSAWKFAADGASLNLPTWVKAMTTGDEPELNIQVVYYDTDGNPLTEYELKGGNKFLVAAYIDPACAEGSNFGFKNQTVDPMTSLTTSPQTTYTVPQSGAAAFMNSVRDFMGKTWLGLPVWAWFLIGLALLILLIIIIVVACKRRKSKEEREEIKARKEEERPRREEERRMQ